jgi:hypothetical protein
MEGIREWLPIREPSGDVDRLPRTEAVLQAIKKLKNNRSSGPDALNAELIKVDDKKLTHSMCKVIEKVRKREKIPRQWEEGLIYPFLKKGDHLVCENYYGITLLTTAYKVFSNILCERLQPYVEKNHLDLPMWIQEWQINIRPDTHGQTDYGKDGRVWGQYILFIC